MSNTIGAALSPSQCQDLRVIAGIMIPANAEFAVPGADDPLIIADILGSLGRDAGAVADALAALAELAGGAFSEQDAARQRQIAETFLARDESNVAVLGRVILQCYYRDDRVMVSLGLEPRSPFPKGHVLEQGDWSLLDAVRSRPKMWRDA
jgi:hypothetical protein